MILVDSSVWVDYFRGTPSPQSELLDRMLGYEPVAIGDLMLVEVLQGFASERDYRSARRLLAAFPVIEIGGAAVAMEAAEMYRVLRRRGVTVRKTIDTLIAARCIRDHHQLLHSDRDFDPFVRHHGLRVVSA